MDKNFENRYLEIQKNWWWFTGRRNLILQLVKDISYNNVLEIGCGSGELSKYLKNYVGIDISERTPFIVGDAQDLPFDDNSFDLILLLDLLEHTNDKLVMNEVYRVLKPDGYVIITVPAFMFLWSQHDVDNHHIKRYRRGELPLDRFFEIEFTYWNCLLFPFMALAKRKKAQLTVLPKPINYILEKFLKLENYLISKRIYLPIGVTLVYKLKKRKYHITKT
jgi:ubiquinone/menaquinone biosynthesis C-methylase UbiE